MSKADDGKVVTVDGVLGRLIPLVVRGRERRKESGFADGELVEITIAGSYHSEDGVSLVIQGPRRGLQDDGPALVPVMANKKTMLSIERSQIARKVERRSGQDRRKA